MLVAVAAIKTIKVCVCKFELSLSLGGFRPAASARNDDDNFGGGDGGPFCWAPTDRIVSDPVRRLERSQPVCLEHLRRFGPSTVVGAVTLSRPQDSSGGGSKFEIDSPPRLGERKWRAQK